MKDIIYRIKIQGEQKHITKHNMIKDFYRKNDAIEEILYYVNLLSENEDYIRNEKKLKNRKYKKEFYLYLDSDYTLTYEIIKN